MAEPLVDLHMHSTHSDGTHDPPELVAMAREAGLAAIALTDHDTVSGLPEFLAAGQKLGVETVPAVELSVQTPFQGIDLLGYLIDHEDPELLDMLEDVRAWRRERLPRMLNQLAEAGVEVSGEQVRAQATSEVVGRPHVARAMVEAGHVETADEAFKAYIGKGGPGYVAKKRLDPKRAIETLHGAGGLAVLAHPCFVHPLHVDEIVGSLSELGLDGLEVWYSRHDGSHVQHFAKLAERYELVKTGGSDYHGGNKPDIQLGRGQGDLAVPYSALEGLRARRAREPSPD